MEQSPSWEANRSSYSRNSPHFMEPESSLPHSQEPSTEGLVWSRGLCVWFVRCLNFYGEEFLSPRQTPRLEDQVQTSRENAVVSTLISKWSQIIRSTCHVWRRPVGNAKVANKCTGTTAPTTWQVSTRDVVVVVVIIIISSSAAQCGPRLSEGPFSRLPCLWQLSSITLHLPVLSLSI